MATKIRLRRMGTINKPFYRIVAADSRFATTGRFLEILGWYDPKQKGANFSVNVERVKHWLGTGAQISNTASSLLKKAEAGLGVPVGPAGVSLPAEKASEQQEA
jgi:small subunit ribosomal protein S16